MPSDVPDPGRTEAPAEYSYEDLVAARVLHRQRPELRQTIALALRRVCRENLDHRTLLAVLVAEESLSLEQAEWAYERVERYLRGRALNVYRHLLVSQGGLLAGDLEGPLEELGEDATRDALGDALVAAGRLSGEQEARLRNRAKLSFDRYKTEQVETYRARQEAESAQTMIGDVAASATGTLEIPDAGEDTAVLGEGALSLDEAAPRFPIPDWIDTGGREVGRVVGGFRILGTVGKGGMGTVYLADHPDHAELIALKVLAPQAEAEARGRFKREILANGFFDHENVIGVHDAGVGPNGTHYLAMEFFEGTDLEQVLESEGRLGFRQSFVILRQILEALEVAHRAGIVHRDLKPANILVSSDGFHAKLMDFGVARIQDLGEFQAQVFDSSPHTVTGTPRYLSPEQALRDPVGPPADLYALGLVLYRMLAGRLPFEAKDALGWVTAQVHHDPLSITQAAPDLQFPRELLTLLDRLLLKEPTMRLQSAREFIDALDAIPLRRPGLITRFFKKVRRGF